MASKNLGSKCLEKDAGWDDPEIDEYLMMKASQFEAFYSLMIPIEEEFPRNEIPTRNENHILTENEVNGDDYIHITEGQSLWDLDENDPWWE